MGHLWTRPRSSRCLLAFAFNIVISCSKKLYWRIGTHPLKPCLQTQSISICFLCVSDSAMQCIVTCDSPRFQTSCKFEHLLVWKVLKWCYLFSSASKKKFQTISFKISGCASEILSISALQQLRCPSRKQLWDLYQTSLPRDIFYSSCPSLHLPTALSIKWESSQKSSVAGIFLYPSSSWLLHQLYGVISSHEKILVFIWC